MFGTRILKTSRLSADEICDRVCCVLVAGGYRNGHGRCHRCCCGERCSDAAIIEPEDEGPKTKTLKTVAGSEPATAAYEKDDFFDSISCDALDKQSLFEHGNPWSSRSLQQQEEKTLN